MSLFKVFPCTKKNFSSPENSQKLESFKYTKLLLFTNFFPGSPFRFKSARICKKKKKKKRKKILIKINEIIGKS